MTAILIITFIMGVAVGASITFAIIGWPVREPQPDQARAVTNEDDV